MNKLKIVTESRDRLYFDQWEYAFSFFLKEAHSLRMRDHMQFHNYINLRRTWTQWQSRFTENVIGNLETAFVYVNNITQPFKLVVSGHWATIYSNDPELSAQMLAACDFLHQSKQKQAVVDQPRDTVLLLNPKHRLRSYFKAQMFPVGRISTLRDFFESQDGAIKPSPGMQNFLKLPGRAWTGNHWIPDHYFVDYDNPAYTTMLAMIMPRAFRKTVSIVQRINT